MQRLIGPDGNGSPQLRAKQRVERLGQLARDRVLIVNEQTPEERQVELPPERPGSFQVGRHAVPHSRQCPLEVALGLLEVALDFGQTAFGALNLPRQPGLLALEQVKRHGIGVVGVEQLLAFSVQADQPPLLHAPFALRIEPQARQFFFQEGPHVSQLLLLELHGGVVPGDGCLHLLNAQRSEFAFGALLLTAQADEVGIGAAPAFSVADDQPGAALAAVDRALEVVRVLTVALARQMLGGQQLLDALPRLVIHQPRMLALVEHALVADNTDVVGMTQQPMQMRDGQRPTRGFWAGQGREPFLGQLGEQSPDRPIARGVCLKGPDHQWRPLRIDLDRAAFQAVDDLAHVQVAERRLAGRAAVLGLLDRALDDLRRQVAAVELRDRGHDAVQQQARWRLINVLAHAHQLRPGLLERQVDERIIGSVTSQAVNLVDDDVLDAVVLDELEQPL